MTLKKKKFLVGHNTVINGKSSWEDILNDRIFNVNISLDRIILDRLNMFKPTDIRTQIYEGVKLHSIILYIPYNISCAPPS